MSRSYRHNPVWRTSSRKNWRTTYNRRLRHHNKLRVLQEKEPLIVREVSDVWDAADAYYGWLIGSERQVRWPWANRASERRKRWTRRIWNK